MKNKSIYLRPFIEGDEIQINQWRNDSSIQALVSSPFRYVSLSIEKEWVKAKSLENRSDLYLAICDINTNEMVGYLSINQINHLHQTAHCGGIVIGNNSYRDGTVLIESHLLAMDYVFNSLNINRYSGACLKGHSTSNLMLQMLGFNYEGCQRQVVFKDGVFHDKLIFSLLKSEYLYRVNNNKYTFDNIVKEIRIIKNKRNENR